MQLHHFINLDAASKTCTVWKQGVLLGHRNEGAYYMSLYRLYNFYVEMYYHTGYDGIACIKTFDCEDELQPYLNKIDISALNEI